MDSPSPAVSVPGARRGTVAWARYRTEIRLLIAVVLLVALFIVLFPQQFGTMSNAGNVLRYASVLLVVAIGQMFAILVGGFDISVGATMGLASTIGAMAMLQYGTVAGIAAGIGVAAVVGVANGILISRYRVSPFIATLGMMTFVGGLANSVSGGRSVFGLPDSFGWFGRFDWGPLPSTTGLAIFCGAAAWLLLSRTRAGLNMYAIGGGRPTAVLAGIPVMRTEVLAYTTCSLFAGIAGLMLASRVVIGQASLGSGYELESIATAVIGGVAIGGGVGRILGVVLGVGLLSLITTGMNIAGLSEFVQQMLTGVVLIVAVLIDRFRGRSMRGREHPQPRAATTPTGGQDPAVPEPIEVRKP
ncbi:ABC transporter permease [Microbacterium capsulatum]|uniref:ABC transporter permease n=1 Tax=Microbacterium capsulatum TaxID=3041921 RepID=A0ABU0XFG1_9MICO|nr:ABC transporter permease [Microbacterium sp. ASV81]MDQ4212940.1 ABC transporter permease [Microbacterium sp. ASV81]